MSWVNDVISCYFDPDFTPTIILYISIAHTYLPFTVHLATASSTRHGESSKATGIC